MKSEKQIFDEYVNEVAIYTRWSNKTKAKYGPEAQDVMRWGRYDYETVMEWNAAMKMVERVLGLTDDEVAEVDRLSIELAKESGQSEPWNYWVETPV